MTVICPSCGRVNQEGIDRCATCGAPLAAAKPDRPPAGGREAGEGPSRQQPEQWPRVVQPGAQEAVPTPGAQAWQAIPPQPKPAPSGQADPRQVQSPQQPPVPPREQGAQQATGAQVEEGQTGPVLDAGISGEQEPTSPGGEGQEGLPPIETDEQAVPSGEEQRWWDGWQWGYGAPQSYGMMPAGMSPWYPPYPVYGYPSPFPGFYMWPYPAPYMPTPFMMMPYPGYFPGQVPYSGSPYPAQQYPYAGAGAAPRKRMHALYIVLIILGALIVIGGGVAAAILLTGNTNATFNLGDGSVVGSDIEFKGMVIKQDGSMLTLTGTYDNTGKYEGDVVVTVQAISDGREQLISFTVPVEPGSGKAFTQQKAAGSIKLSGATLSSLVVEGGVNDSGNTDTYPWDQQTSQPTSPTYPTSPTTPTYPTSPTMPTYPTSPTSPVIPETSPYDEGSFPL